MNAYLRFGAVELWQVAGWTMLHFLWLAAMVGIAAGALRILLRRASPNTRYVTATATFAVLGGLPLGIAAWLITTHPTDFFTEDVSQSHRPTRSIATQSTRWPIATPTPSSVPSDQNTGHIVELSGRTDAPQTEASAQAPELSLLPSSQARFEVARPSPTEGSPNLPSASKTEGLSASMQAAVHPSASIEWWQAMLVASLQSCALYLPWVWLIGTPVTLRFWLPGLLARVDCDLPASRSPTDRSPKYSRD